MRLAPVDAQRFIQGYKLLMLEVLGEQEDRGNGNVVPLLAKARAKLAGEPTLLRKSIVQLEARNARLDREVVMALEGLEVRQWVYLRDTKLHSIIIDSSADRAFGVIGLTQGGFKFQVQQVKGCWAPGPTRGPSSGANVPGRGPGSGLLALQDSNAYSRAWSWQHLSPFGPAVLHLELELKEP